MWNKILLVLFSPIGTLQRREQIGYHPICSPKMYSQNFCAEEVGKLRRQIRDPTRLHKCHYGPIQPTKPLGSVIYKHPPAKNVRSHLKDLHLVLPAACVHLNLQ